MIELRVFGAVGLDSDGVSNGSVIAQPRRTALLCYLALARPPGFYARDTIFAMFWPDHDSEHARHALRQALYFLRRSLDQFAIQSRGDGALGIGPVDFRCDALEFQYALKDGRLIEALSLYQSDLLPGFYISDSPAFERWLDDERSFLRQRAADAAWSLAARTEEAGDAVGSASWAKRAADFSPGDETVLRRLLTQLDRLGDLGAALRAYDRFAANLAREYDVSPSLETRALVQRLRERAKSCGTVGIARASETAPDPAFASVD